VSHGFHSMDYDLLFNSSRPSSAILPGSAGFHFNRSVCLLSHGIGISALFAASGRSCSCYKQAATRVETPSNPTRLHFKIL
jgi:hypothetical protein